MLVAPLAKVGKVSVLVLRDSGAGGGWVDGEYIESPKTTVTIVANIQPALTNNMMRTLPEGERTKQAIAIYSRQELFMAEEGIATPRKADVVSWDGKQWEVHYSMTYKMGILNHCEAIALRLDDV